VRESLIPLVLSLLLYAPALVAQSETATAAGSIRDIDGGAIANAAVIIRNIDTGFRRESTTTPDGRYWLAALPPGRYELTAQRDGFRTVVRSGITLTLGVEAVLDLALPVAPLNEIVTVNADVPIVDTTTAAIETGLNRTQLEILPLFGRDYLSLVRLAPGTQDSGDSFTGSRERSNEFTLDGVDNTSDISGFSRSSISLDSIQEIQVLANNYKAEHGRASGGIINVISRSGGNRASGSLFLTVSDAALNSQSPYVDRQVPELPYRLLMFGGTSGGAFVPDRWHYFITYEGNDQDSQLAATQVMPPSTAAFSAATRQFLASNNIPIAVFGNGGLVRQVRPEHLGVHNLSGRVDGRLNPSQNITARYMFRRSSRSSGQGGTLFDYNGDSSLVRDNYIVASHKWMLGSDRLNEAYFQGGHTLSNFLVLYPSLTNVSVTGNFTLGGSTSFPQGRTEPLYQAVDNFTILRRGGRFGDHVVKLGANVKIFRSDSYFDANVRGTYTFTSLQQFILGQPSSFSQMRGDTSLARPNTLTGVYAQDDWRPRADLTLNLGLRYDYESARTEALREITGEPGPGISGDKNNFAPRVGVVWAPGGDTRQAIHAGAGLYYDQVILNVLGNVRFTPPKVISTTIFNPSFPDPTSGLQTTPPPAIQSIDPDLETPYNFNSSIGYRRELAPNLGIDVSYVHNRGWKQIMTVDRNAGIPGTANILGQGAQGRNPAIAADTFSTNLGFIRYHGLIVDVEKRLSKGIQAGLVYTLSRTVDNGFSFSSVIQVPTRPDLNEGPGANDRRHELKTHFELMLPFDFQLGGVAEYYSEAPLNITVARDDNGDGIINDWVNEDICLTLACPGFRYSRNNVTELSTADANRLRTLFGQGPIAEFANNPKFFNVNMALQKSLRLSSRRIRLRGEAFNVFNTPQRVIGSTSVTSAIFGTYVGVVQPRAIQLSTQFDW
jgi:hypothetical protein